MDERWRRWREDRGGNQIFWEFIEYERNNVLKAYDFGYKESDVQITSTRPDGTEIEFSNVPFFNELRTGPFVGQPGLVVATRAVAPRRYPEKRHFC